MKFPFKIYPNNKSYVPKDIKDVINARKVAFRNKDSGALNLADKNLRNKLREAKAVYRRQDAFKANNRKKVWDTMKSMTGMSSPTKPIVTDSEIDFADNLNAFFARFESPDNSNRCTETLRAVTPAPSDRIIITEEDVRKVFQCTNIRKATGPDECSAFLMKNFATVSTSVAADFPSFCR